MSTSQCATPESAAMGRSVLAAALVLSALLVVQLPAGDCGGGKICFSNPDCTGSQIPAGSAEDCCVGTDDGFSYGIPGNCRECIVHGFTLTAYSTDEDSPILTGTFGINRKGNSSLLTSLPGTITSMDITATESRDYGRLVVNVGPVDREIPFELDLINDNLALEFVEELSLDFVVDRNFQVIVDRALDAGEFFRDSVIVSINDTSEMLEINFNEQDRSEIENAVIPLENEVTLSLRPTQIPFTIEIIHTTIPDALDESRATPDADFVAFSYTLEIPAMTETITLSNVSILDDNINEAEEVFAVVIRLIGAAESTACFQQQRGGTCMGNTGRIIIRIRDDDPMFIGFGTRNTFIFENKFPDQDSFFELFNVVSNRTSELTYEMTFSVTGQRTAVVVARGEENVFSNWDVSFGERSKESPSDPPFIGEKLEPGLLMLSDNLDLFIHDDFDAEETEFFTLRITAQDVARGVFECYDDTEEPVLGNYFCSHTFFIVDEDIPLNVSFVETVYTVVERDEMVEVCVNLTMPDADIFENTVNVEVFVDDNSIYIPPNARIATGRLPPPFLPEPSPPFDEDYPQQLLGLNDLRDIQILETRRTICYNQTVYDDVRLEVDEYTGLTLIIGDNTARTETGINQTAIRIIDDDVARVGIDPTFRQVSETVGLVEICAVVFEPTIECPIEFDFSVSLSTSDGSAETPMDYEEVDTILIFRSCETRVCTNVTIEDDSVAETAESFSVKLNRTDDLDPRITLDPVVAEIEIIDNDAELPILVNDTVTGDPLMTVPILTDEDVAPGYSLCYEVHGEADYVFNLVSDTCVTVNAHYAKAPINSPNIDLNVVDAIGVRAVSDGGTCENISVGLQGCQATVNGVDINGVYQRDGISVREYANRVRIVVPNCRDTDLVMWVFCMNGKTEDPVTKEFYNFDFVRFVVRRGLNLAEESHGLIGQFWNVPIDLAKYTGNINGVQRNISYTITVKYPESVARSFVGLLWSVTWEFEDRPCLYVGNSQAGPLGEKDVDPNDSVIEGSYVDYRVDSMFSSNFTFSHFEETRCSA